MHKASWEVLSARRNSKRSNYERLLQRLNEVSNQRDSSAVSALASLNESAVPSRVVDSPRKSQLTLLASSGALLLGIFYVLSRELMRGAPGAARRASAARTGSAGADRASSRSVFARPHEADATALAAFADARPAGSGAGRDTDDRGIRGTVLFRAGLGLGAAHVRGQWLSSICARAHRPPRIP